MKKIVLASTSKRRFDLLHKAGIAFETVQPSYDESKHLKEAPENAKERACFFALGKARSVAKNYNENYIVIGADTVVVADDVILGKPKDFDEAFKMIKLLSGRKHSVITGVAIIDGNREFIEGCTTTVEFNPLSNEEIISYINDKKPFDKAGAYGIQELPENFLRSFEGDFYNVVGLPVDFLLEKLKILRAV